MDVIGNKKKVREVFLSIMINEINEHLTPNSNISYTWKAAQKKLL